jgi:hypothetical protein
MLTLAGATAAFFRSIAILKFDVCVKGCVTKLRRSYLFAAVLELKKAGEAQDPLNHNTLIRPSSFA